MSAAPITPASPTPASGSEAALIDRIGNEVYAAHYTERRMAKLAIGSLAGLSLLLGGGLVLVARRPAITRYVRIDDIGRAQAIQYSDLSYSPREGEVRTYLTDWANYRYTVNRETIAAKYPLNFYFLSQQLASERMADDNASHFASQVMSGQVEQSDVEVRNVTITSMGQETAGGVTLARGTALVNIDRLYSARNSREPRVEHWLLSVTYFLDPKEVSDQARTFPQFETINPLGLTITEVHENRVAVELTAPGGTPVAATPTRQPGAGR